MKRVDVVVIVLAFAASLAVAFSMACGGTWPRTVDIHIGAEAGVRDAAGDS